MDTNATHEFQESGSVVTRRSRRRHHLLVVEDDQSLRKRICDRLIVRCGVSPDSAHTMARRIYRKTPSDHRRSAKEALIWVAADLAAKDELRKLRSWVDRGVIDIYRRAAGVQSVTFRQQVFERKGEILDEIGEQRTRRRRQERHYRGIQWD